MTTQNPAQGSVSFSGDERVQPDGPLSGEVKREGASAYQLAPKRRGQPAKAWCSVYLVTNGERLTKVGMSTDPTKRLNSLRTATAEKLALEHTWRLTSRDGAAAFERALHHAFNWGRARREWFAVEARWIRCVGEALLNGDERLPALLEALQMAWAAENEFNEAHRRYGTYSARWGKEERAQLSAVMDVTGETMNSAYALALHLGLEPTEWDRHLFEWKLAQ